LKNNELHYFGIILCKHKSNGRLPIYSTFLVHSQITTCIHWPCCCTVHVYVVIHWNCYCTVLVYVVIHFCDNLRCFGMKANMCMLHKLDSTNISVEYIPIFIVKHTIERGLLLEVEQCNTNNGYNITYIVCFKCQCILPALCLNIFINQYKSQYMKA
jgi:hypothetical protein